MPRVPGLALAIAVVFASAATAATTHYVNGSTGLDTNPGTSGSPFKTITHAVAVTVSGDTISVAAGTYNPTLGESFPITVPSGVQLIGAGASTTTIDAAQTNRVIHCSGNSPTTLIQGFKITGGYFKQTSIGSNSYGGGIWCENNDMTVISRNVITINTVVGYDGSPSGGFCLGGGIYVASGSPTIVNNVISHNTTYGGAGATTTQAGLAGGSGGDATGGGIASFGTPIIRNNTIVKNTAQGGNGGVSGFGGGGSAGGSANSGGVSASGATVINNVIDENTAAGGLGRNGGANGTGSTGGMSGSGTIDHNLFFGNSPDAGSTGTSAITASNPLFIDSVNENYHITPSSPAKGAGTATGAPAVDLDGVTRANPPSIGAYEGGVTHYSVTAPASATAGSSFSVTVTALDAANATFASYTGTVHFTSSDGSATLPANYTFAGGDAGVHTFSVTLQTSGSQSVTATDVATSSINGSASVQVLAPFGAPPNFSATATSTTQVSLSWTAVANANHYEVWRNSGAGFGLLTSPASATYTDSAVLANTTYVYKVLAVDASNTKSAYSNADAATTILFTDDPIVIGSTVVKAVHITELRTAVNAMRAAAGLGAATFTDTNVSGLAIKAVHVSELRTALDAARSGLALPPLTYTDPTLTAGSTSVKGAHFQELRNGVK